MTASARAHAETESAPQGRPMRIIWRLIGERKGLFTGNLALRLIKDLLPFQGPILVGITVDLLSGTDRSFFGIDFTPNDVRSIVIIAVLMAVLAVLKTAIGYIHTIVSAHMGRHVVQAARRDLAEASMQMALDERRRFNSGDLLDRCLADSKGLRSFTQNVVIRVISNTVRAVYPLTLMFMIDPLMAVVVLAVLPLQSGVSGLLQRRLQRQTHDARAQEASHTSAVKEAIDGWSSVASVGGQDWAAREIIETASASEDAKIIKKHTTAWISAVITLCTALGIAACYAVGGWRIIESGALDPNSTPIEGALTLGALTTFIGVAKKTYAPFQAYTKIVSSYRTGLVNLERIADVLDAPMLDTREDGPQLRLTEGDIELRDVSFSYNSGEMPTLRALTGRIPGRSLTVITGSSGTGKTTLLRLLLGLDVPDTGTISIDGQDINVAQLDSVKRAIVLVPQEPMLFSGTVSDNLLLGQEGVTTQELLEACNRAGLLEMVSELPKGLDTEVGSGSHMLSGGQLRRLAIARALLRRPGVLLLDEPTTGLDEASSAKVLDTLRSISDQTTVVMVSHRRDPLSASDHHLILRDGAWTRGALPPPQEAASFRAPARQSTVGQAPETTSTAPAMAEPAHAANGSPTSNGHAASNGSAAPNGHAASNGSAASNGHRNAAIIGEQPTDGTTITFANDPTPTAEAAAPDVAGRVRNVVALSTMGRPITMYTSAEAGASHRVLVLGGHRSEGRIIAELGDALLLRSDISNDGIALAFVPDVNPDGVFEPNRTNALGIDVSADHLNLDALETRAMHKVVEAFAPDLIVDVAQTDATQPDAPAVAVSVRYLPTSRGGVPSATKATAIEIRRRLDASAATFGVSLTATGPNSAASVLGIPLVQITATSVRSGRESQIIGPVIEAIVAAQESAPAAAGQLITV